MEARLPRGQREPMRLLAALCYFKRSAHVKAIAAHLEMSERQVRHYVARARDMGWVACERGIVSLDTCGAEAWAAVHKQRVDRELTKEYPGRRIQAVVASRMLDDGSLGARSTARDVGCDPLTVIRARRNGAIRRAGSFKRGKRFGRKWKVGLWILALVPSFGGESSPPRTSLRSSSGESLAAPLERAACPRRAAPSPREGTTGPIGDAVDSVLAGLGLL